MSDVPKRVYVTLPETVHADLERWSKMRDQAIATSAAVAIEMHLEGLKARGELPTADTDSTSK